MESRFDFPEDKLPHRRIIYGILIAVTLFSLLIRGFMAWILELGNDEVYYWTYALFPDLSHFDHPPMVGFTIQAFSWNLYFDSELFIRLGSVVLGAANTWIIFLIAKKVRGLLAGLFAAMLYNTSVYCFVIAGVFILPDTPQLFFWLISLYILVVVLPGKPITKNRATGLFFAAFPIGLAMLSKYTSVFLWLGAGLYILLYNREWLRKSELYLSFLLTFLIFSPIVLWNIENEFISFTFQGERVSFFGAGLRPDYFFTELLGQISYNNPVNYFIIIGALVALWHKRFQIDNEQKRILLLTSLPLILTFLFFSLFRRTLPHWTAPAYIGLIVIASAYLADKAMKPSKAILFPKSILLSGSLLAIILVLGLLQIKLGLIQFPQNDDPKRLGENDVTLDMYGWKQLGYKFSQIVDADFYKKNMNADAPIISNKWFPAAHIDYYVARPYDYFLITIGDIQSLHKYAWINRDRPAIRPGSDAYFITGSRDFKSPEFLLEYFEKIENPEIIRIFKGDKHVENFFVYRLRNCETQPPDILSELGIPEKVNDYQFEEDTP